MQAQTATFWIAASLSLLAMTSGGAGAAINIPFTINLSETVTVTGTPRITVDVGGNTRYATYTSGTGTNALTFTLSPNIGDVDLDGVTISSPIDLNGGTIKDTTGNDATLTFTPPNTAGIKINYPSLGMDFTNGASGRYTLNGTVYNNISSFLTASGGTFARNSIATYYDSTGILQTASANTPRFDYDPVTHQAKGILIEESRTNLLKDSANPTTANWTRARVSATAGTSLAPDNTMSGSTLTITNPSAPGIFQKFNLAAGYVFSAYIKAGSATSADVGLYNYTALSWGAATSESKGRILQGPGTISQSYYGMWNITGLSTTQWTRFSVYRSTPSDGALIYPKASSGGTIGDSVIVWGEQVETGTDATSYIPTTSTAVTRQADMFTIPTGGWYNVSKGTMLSRYDIPYLTGTNYPGTAVISNGTGANGNILYVNATSKYRAAQIKSGNIISFNQGAGAASTLTENTPTSDALAYEENNANFAASGGIGTVDTVVTIPASVSNLYIGGDGLGITSKLNGRVSIFKYYPLRVGDTQLQLLTQ